MKDKLLQEYTEKKVDSEHIDEAGNYPLENEVPQEYSNEAESIAHEEHVEIEDDLDINAVNSEDPSLAAAGLQSDFDEINDEAPDVDQGFSKVAISSKSSLAMMVIAALVLIFILYKVLQPEEGEDSSKAQEIDISSPISKPIEDTGQTIIVPEIPKLPTAPILQAPAPAPAPAPPPVIDINMSAPQITPIGLPAPTENAVSNDAFKKSSSEDLARKKARLASSMMTGGSSTLTANLNKDGQSLSILKRNNNQIVATNIGDLRRVIAQGKMIDAILETAINTDIPGSVRALVSRDIYSEAGKNVLVPRGSRLVGHYSSDITFGINRTKVSWTRLIRPDGVDINIASSGTDQLGRAGTSGDLDNHFMRSLSAAVMSSVIDIAVAAYADKQAPINTQSTAVESGTGTIASGSGANTSGTTVTGAQVTTGGSTITQGDTPSRQSVAYTAAAQNIGETGKSYLEKTKNIAPTLTVDQGTPLKVFVNKDLVFPGKSANLTMVIE